MILYKYLSCERIDVLRDRRIRFTQPGDFNDPFEFRPVIKEISSEDSVKAYVEKNFDHLVETEVAKYGSIIPPSMRELLPSLLAGQKKNLPALFQALSPELISSIQPRISDLLNQVVGMLCLSEIRDSVLMWGHYAANHRGFVVGFDSEDPFFHIRRSNADEFGFLRRVKYTIRRPNVTLANSDSVVWFEQKLEDWNYEKEWRILRVLNEANFVIDRKPFPIHLFGFAPSAIREVIAGMNSDTAFQSELRGITRNFPGAKYFIAKEHPKDYRVIIDQSN